jgi:hypothetical protein
LIKFDIYNDEWLAQKGIGLLSRSELEEHLTVKPVVDVEQYSAEKEITTSTRGYAIAL